MIEKLDLSVENTNWKLHVRRSTKLFAKVIDKPKIAICPKCGEISLYIDNLESIVSEAKP
jgi:hypothetical protein